MSSSLKQQWRFRHQLFASAPPAAARHWLFDPASLTARLIRLCAERDLGCFRVELVDQRMAAPTQDECRVLGIRDNRWALVRQVKLICGDTALVYARTVIPVSTMTGRQRLYANLGNRPLGAMLFADRSMRREDVMVTCLEPGSALHAQTGAGDEAVWGRRSVFRVGGKPLLVSEYFLPELLRIATI